MKLLTYLDKENLTASEFAARAGCAVSTVTRAVRRELATSWKLRKRFQEASDGKIRAGTLRRPSRDWR